MTTTTTLTTADTKLQLGKFILSFLAILLYMGLYGLLFLPIMVVEGSDLFVPLLIIWSIGAFVFFFLWFIGITPLIWSFDPAPVTPVPFADLKKELLSLQRPGLPFTVTEKTPEHLILSWNYVDAKWWELFRKAGMRGAYRLHVKLNPKKNEAKLIDVVTSINWNKGPTGFHYKFTFFRGIDLEVSIGKAWGIRENFSLGKIYDFKFNNAELKYPVMNTLLRSGWKVRFALF